MGMMVARYLLAKTHGAIFIDTSYEENGKKVVSPVPPSDQLKYVVDKTYNRGQEKHSYHVLYQVLRPTNRPPLLVECLWLLDV
ncbi:hypothetical protein DAPPUDRAFT_274949, partial [Daphnia pulex]